MKVLLVYPEFPNTFWSHDFALKMVRKRAVSPPLGLLTVAALLPADWEKRLVDLNIGPLTKEALAWADYVFVSGMSVQRDAAKEIIARAKKAGKIVVAGGPLFTAEYATFDQVDHFVLNEGELTLPPFLADLANGCAKRTYRTRAFADLTKSPTPLWNLVDLKAYHSGAIQYSRGCPFDCEFCNVTALFGRAPRVKTGAQIIGELNALQASGCADRVFFVDDNLIGNKPAAKKDLLPALAKWQTEHHPMRFNTQASMNLADDEAMTSALVKGGFDAVFVGIETPDAADLAECGKTQNLKRDLLEDVKRLQRAGLEVQAGFIVGFDNDKQDIFQRQIDFIQRSGILTAMVGLLHAPPGTRLAERMRKEGRYIGPSSGDNTDGSTNIVPRMGIKKLRAGYDDLIEEIYSPAAFYKRAKTFLKEFAPQRRAQKIDPRHLAAMLHSFVRLGIFGKERFHYWGLLAWTLTHRPKLIPDAFRMAICGYHYRRISEITRQRTPVENPFAEFMAPARQNAMS